MSKTRNAYPTVDFEPNANVSSIRGLAFACAGSMLACTVFLVGFVFDLSSGRHLSLFHLFGMVLFGSLSADWLGRLIRITAVRQDGRR
jgi:hypothetical protein